MSRQLHRFGPLPCPRRPCWLGVLLLGGLLSTGGAATAQPDSATEARIAELIAEMSLDEKIGQMSLRGFSSRSTEDPAVLEDAIRSGRIGALLNVTDPETVGRLQRIAVEESPNRIPILFGRDVIHGFRTIFPIPLGQAATWNPDLARDAARIAAREANAVGIRWTFAPMVDIARDPRWGRIAESPGEDPLLAERFAVAMIEGFQTADPTAPGTLAACAKHYAAYGAAEGGRDYNGVEISEALLRNVYLRPFRASVDAGAASFMTAFNEVNGVPASGDPFLLRDVLREEWGFPGLVVSDWDSVTEMIAHGFAADEREAARIAAGAGVDLEMTSHAFEDHLASLVADGSVSVEIVDEAVANVLRTKLELGLFERPYHDPEAGLPPLSDGALELARESARQSLVLLKNDGVLPLSGSERVAVIGPLADAPHEQLGTWTFDGRAEDSRTPLGALRDRLGDDRVLWAPGLDVSRTRSREGFSAALSAARQADIVLFFGGEEAILSGEAHSRADLRLPGAQEELIQKLTETGKPVVVVLLSGRPNTIEAILGPTAALIAAWHPGTMAGPAIADVLYGDVSPGGRLPVTWPIDAGQTPIYYNHKNTGRPAPDELQAFDDIPVGAWQSSLSNTSRYLDLGAEPRFPFGYGLTYGDFEYSVPTLSATEAHRSDTVTVTVEVANRGPRAATEVVQLYSRDLVGRLTRPVRELRDFRRVSLAPGESVPVRFELPLRELAYFDNQGRKELESGTVQLIVGPNAAEGASVDLTVNTGATP